MKQHIKTVKEFKKCILDANITISAQHSEFLDEVVKAAERYEFIRTLTVPDFKRLYVDNVNGYGRFDDLVDAMMNSRKCRKCGAEMKDGKAIEQTYTGMPDFIGGECCTISPGGSGKLIECKKCPECGWSVTK